MASDRREHALDGLRGLAALAVLGFHTWLYRDNRPLHQRPKGLLNNVFFNLNVGLICFFVLSGYLLYRPYARAARTGERPVDVRGYGLRRVARIVPAYYAVIAGALILYAIVGYHAITPDAGALGLFAVFGQNYSMDTVMHIDPVTWTLCIEAAFYVFLPLVGLAVWRLGPQRAGWHAALLVALVAVTVVWNTLAFEHRWNATLTKSLPAWLGEFALGMLVAHWVVRRERGPGLEPRARMRASVTALIAAAGAVVVLRVRLLELDALVAGRGLAQRRDLPCVRARLRADRRGALRGPRPGRPRARRATAGVAGADLLRRLPLAPTADPDPQTGRRVARATRPAARGCPGAGAGGRGAELALHRAPGDRLGSAPRAALGRASRRAGGDRRTGGAPAARDGPGDAVTAAEVVGATLARLGVDVVFGLLGSGNLVATNALVAGGATYHAARHEGGATSMADGWARVTGRVGVVSVHQGPGLTNTMTALAEAAKSRTPLLVLAGDTPAAARRSNFRIDQHGLVESVGAIADRVHSPATAAADAARALARAQLERRPVVLMMPIDLQAADGDTGRRRRRSPRRRPGRRPAPEAVAHAAQLLAGAAAPADRRRPRRGAGGGGRRPGGARRALWRAAGRRRRSPRACSPGAPSTSASRAVSPARSPPSCCRRPTSWSRSARRSTTGRPATAS